MRESRRRELTRARAPSHRAGYDHRSRRERWCPTAPMLWSGPRTHAGAAARRSPRRVRSRLLASQRDALREALTARRSLRAAILALSPEIVDECELRRFGNPERCASTSTTLASCVSPSVGWLRTWRVCPGPRRAAGQRRRVVFQRQARVPGDPARQRRSGTLGGVGRATSELEQFSDLLHREPLHPGLAGEGGDPLIACHRSQLRGVFARALLVPPRIG